MPHVSHVRTARLRVGPGRSAVLILAAVLLPVLLLAPAAVAQTTGTPVDRPDSFTSSFRVRADADQVPETDGRRGEPGATGTFDLQLDSTSEVICFDIALDGVTPPFQSPAPTATHVHDGAVGVAGPAVVLFPNPEASSDGSLRSSGCLQRPFTGDAASAGFSLAEIEAGPTGYYVDNHTSQFVPGSVRGQFGQAMPSGGVATGGGGTAADDPSGIAMIALAALTATTLAGIALGLQARRRSHGGS